MRNPPDHSRIHTRISIPLRDQESKIVWDIVKTQKWISTWMVPFGELVSWTRELKLEAQYYLLMERGLS